MKYQDLSGAIKEKIRDKLRYSNRYLDYEWWDGVYDYAKEVGAAFGLRIDDISFSGFSSQGDGSCFEGVLYFKECDEGDLPEDVKPVYQTLKEPAALLSLMDEETYAVSISTSGRYCHSNTMSFEFNYTDFTEEGEEVLEQYADDIEQALRDFADWIYSTLEEEHEWLTSDECIDDILDSREYDEEGNEI